MDPKPSTSKESPEKSPERSPEKSQEKDEERAELIEKTLQKYTRDLVDAPSNRSYAKWLIANPDLLLAVDKLAQTRKVASLIDVERAFRNVKCPLDFAEEGSLAERAAEILKEREEERTGEERPYHDLDSPAEQEQLSGLASEFQWSPASTQTQTTPLKMGQDKTSSSSSSGSGAEFSAGKPHVRPPTAKTSEPAETGLDEAPFDLRKILKLLRKAEKDFDIFAMKIISRLEEYRGMEIRIVDELLRLGC